MFLRGNENISRAFTIIQGPSQVENFFISLEVWKESEVRRRA